MDGSGGAPQWLEGYQGLDVEEMRARAKREGRRFRVVGPDGVVTMDFDERRVTAWTDADGRVKRVAAG